MPGNADDDSVKSAERVVMRNVTDQPGPEDAGEELFLPPESSWLRGMVVTGQEFGSDLVGDSFINGQ